jgi:hypothetical protein
VKCETIRATALSPRNFQESAAELEIEVPDNDSRLFLPCFAGFDLRASRFYNGCGGKFAMNVESLISGMNRGEMLDAMEIIWRKLSAQPDSLDSPDWHQGIIEERLRNPSDSPLSLDESKAEIKDRLNARRTKD